MERYLVMSDAELEDTANDRAAMRNAKFDIDREPGEGTFRASFKVPSALGDGEDVVLLSAESAGRRQALIDLLSLDDLTPP